MRFPRPPSKQRRLPMKTKPETEKIIEKDGRRYREKLRPSALPFWAAAAVWLIAALFLPMYNMLHLIGIALVSIGAGLLTAKFAPTKTELAELPFYEGNNDLNLVARQIASARDVLRDAQNQCAEKKPETSALLGGIEATCGKIQAAVLASPDDLPKIRRFLNYYLPTTEKLANKYTFLLTQDGGGANIAETAANIEQALRTVRSAFDAQLDALFSDDALDISTDITVLEMMLTRDNLK
ncbi:MAG: hypothetical protein E7662_12935 [Ruminococcaceae bacterium]|nr:hypothetical protein [Oscillospiraceae bacterium]